jgi:hypothetical protein
VGDSLTYSCITFLPPFFHTLFYLTLLYFIFHPKCLSFFHLFLRFSPALYFSLLFFLLYLI